MAGISSRGVRASSSQSIYFSPFLRTSVISRKIHEEGILIGKVIGGDKAVFWNPMRSVSPHVVVVGPTGSGKTESLLSISTRANLIYSLTVLMIDFKGDIASRLLRRGYRVKLVDVPEDPLGTLYPFHVEPLIRASQVFDALEASYDLEDLEVRAAAYKAIRRAFENSHAPSWRDVISSLPHNAGASRDVLLKIFGEVSRLDGTDYKGHYSIEEGAINVLSLSRLSKEREELLSYAATMVFQDMINYMSSGEADPGRLRGALVIDEAWILLRQGRSSKRILNLVKLSRGYGLSVMMATQSFRDFGDQWERIMDNVGLLIVLNTPSKRFWQDASMFLRIDREAVERLMIVMGRGDAVVRLAPDPRPLPVDLDVDLDAEARTPWAGREGL